ncbi:hypothetical protein [Candidatus Ulvibacter alkanivorans]|uniref:hypothetical protein n=1 Tax=Candidatus Ulvibacter alkanivorans TaxID=2267620 RepID=UPI000DF41D96|nr:hypothetical protein [Candidatus Ulvibacter alkanivorans]
MLYIANVSTEYKLKGLQDYEVRVGSQQRFRKIGQFSHNADETIASFFLKAAAAIEAFSPGSDIMQALLETTTNPENKPKLNLVALIIANVSENYQQGGVQKYEARRLCDNKETNFQETLASFEHLYEEGATECFLKAVKAIDPVVKNIDYKSIIENLPKSKKSTKRNKKYV